MTLVEKAKAYNRELKEALQMVFDALNHGQQQKLMKNPTVKELLTRYGIEVKKNG